MSLSDRLGQKNFDKSGVSYLSQRTFDYTKSKIKNPKIQLFHEEHQMNKRFENSIRSINKKKNKAILTNIEDSIAPEIILNKKTCSICEKSFLIKYMKQFGQCHHSFCESCLKQYSRFKLSQFKLINCPFEGCKVFLQKSTHNYDDILTKEEQLRHQKIYRQLQILSNPDLKSCKDQNCHGIINFKEFIEEQKKNPKTIFQCKQCHLEYCIQCKQQKHQGKCEIQIVKFLQKNNKLRQCKRCKRVIEKSEGCTHMTCLCGFYFCYMCGQQLMDEEHQCNIPQDLNCLQKIRWDIEHREMFYENNFLSFHRWFYYFKLSTGKPPIVHVLYSLVYTMTVYPISVVGSILLAFLSVILILTIFTIFLLVRPFTELCNNRQCFISHIIEEKVGFYGLVLCIIMLYPVFFIVMTTELIIYIFNDQESSAQLAQIFLEIFIGLRNFIIMPFILCIPQQTSQNQHKTSVLV